MRLLYIDEQGEFCLTADLRDNVPPYGILSHRWRKAEEEVTFKDVNDKTGHLRKGIDKLLFCAACANQDGLRYFWIDTCCIDKSSSLEVSRSITSMFKWYQDAQHCYVYLDDIKIEAQKPMSLDTLAQSLWFTRGWTLQELLAPRSVKLFDGNSTFLGNREQLAPLIHQITGIDIRALTGAPLDSFSEEERFRWAASRSTTEPEDKAYSLLGLFGVTMLPHYGEGRENAFNRLKQQVITKHYQELLKLDTERLCYPAEKQATQAGAENVVDRTTEHSDVLGMTIQQTMNQLQVEDTDPIRSLPQQNLKKMVVRDVAQVLTRREQILDALQFDDMDARRSTITPALKHTCGWLLEHPMYRQWKSDNQASSFLWIRGHAGAGKSTLMRFADHHISNEVEADGGLLISFYFNARGGELEYSVNGLYRSMIIQIMTGIPSVSACLDTLTFGRRGLPTVAFYANASTAVLQEVLAAAIARLEKRIYCLIDALDETSQDDVHDMVDFLAQQGKLRVCFASRHYPALDLGTPLKLDIDHESGHSRDITKYLESKLRIGAGPRADAVKKDLLTKANGIFMWVILVVTILNKEFRRGTIVLVQQRLQQVPPRLSELLKEISQQGDIDNADFLLCLQWLLFSKRPLRLEEFYPAMLAGLSEMQGLTFDEREEPPDREQMKNFMLTYSKGLAELTQALPQSLQFIHESIREYLLKNGGLKDLCEGSNDFTAASGHERLKNCCYRTLVGASESQMRWTWPALLSPLNWTLSEGTDPDSEEQSKRQKMRQMRMMPKIESAAYQMQRILNDIPTAILQRHQASTDMLHTLISEHAFVSATEEKKKDEVLEALEYLLYEIDEILQDRAFEAVKGASPARLPDPRRRRKLAERLDLRRAKKVRNTPEMPFEMPITRSTPPQKYRSSEQSITDFLEFIKEIKPAAKPIGKLAERVLRSSEQSITDFLEFTKEIKPAAKPVGTLAERVLETEVVDEDDDSLQYTSRLRPNSRGELILVETDSKVAKLDDEIRPELADSLELIDKHGASGTGEAFGPSLEDSLPFFEYAVTFLLYHSEQAAETISQHDFLAHFDLQRWKQAVRFAPELIRHDYSNLLSVLTSQGYTRLVKTLLKIDSSQVNARELDRKTPLIIATKANHIEVMKVLLEAGADVHARDESGRTAMRYARCKEVEQLLLDEIAQSWRRR